MPITYEVHNDGHFIHAVAKSPVTVEEFFRYELAHSCDGRLTSPVYELLEIYDAALKNITMDNMQEVIELNHEVENFLQPHRCAITVHPLENYSWDLVTFYRGMVKLHYLETVHIFSSPEPARKWLGVDDIYNSATRMPGMMGYKKDN